MSRPEVLAKAAILLSLTLCTTSCVSYSRFELTETQRNEYKSLAKERRDSIAAMTQDHLRTYRDNELLSHQNQLLHNELNSTRTQYSQLQVANVDVLKRYDRSLAQSSFENETNYSEVQRLSEAATRRETESVQAQRRNEHMASLLAAQATAPPQPSPEAVAPLTRGTRSSSSVAAQTPLPPATSYDRSRAENVYLAMKSAIVGFTSKEASVVRQQDFVIVRLSEHLVYPSEPTRVSSLGLAALRQIASGLRADRGMQAIVYAQSRREGTAVQLQRINATQSQALGEALILQGAEPGQIAVDEAAISASRVDASGSLGTSLDGELVLLIRERDFRAGASMFGAN